MTKRAPPRDGSARKIVPPCSAMMPWQMARPRPVPTPIGLVVKNGSKTFCKAVRGIPRSVVLDGHLNPDPRLPRHDAQRAGILLRAHGLLGVVKKIQQDLLDLMKVEERQGKPRLEVRLERDVVHLEVVHLELEGLQHQTIRPRYIRSGGDLRAKVRRFLTIREARIDSDEMTSRPRRNPGSPFCALRSCAYP